MSAGFDAHERDPLGGMRLTTGGFARLTRPLCAAAADGVLRGPASCCVTEGGYDLPRPGGVARRDASAAMDGRRAAGGAVAATPTRGARPAAAAPRVRAGARAVQSPLLAWAIIDQDMTEYNPQAIEQKWQQRWRDSRAFEVTEDPSKPEVLLPRDVRVPVGARARRPRPQLHDRRRDGAHEADARLQRAAPVRLGRLRPAGRERGHQERHPPRDLDARQHRPHEGAARSASASATPGSARSPPACPTTTSGTSGSSCRCSSATWRTASARR